MNSRLKKLIASFASRKIDGLLVPKDVNILYLTGFPAGESWLFVTPKRSFYLTDARYTEEARKGLKGIEVIDYGSSINKSLYDIAAKMKIKRIGFDERQLSVFQYNKLNNVCRSSVKLCPASDMVENIRSIKEPGEVRVIRQALKVHHKALVMLKRAIRPGVKESDILAKLENFIKEQKVGFSFDPIIASGPNSAFPHAKVSSRKFGANEVVLIDIGIDINGYKSDLTRIFFLGRIPELVKQVHDAVKQAQRLAIKKIRVGVAVADVDKIARNYLKEKNLSRYFSHSLGHGVGLEIHESPRLSERDPSILKEGMVVTVEPGVYIPGKFGIRLEEMVLVTKKGCEVLSGNIDQ